MPQCHDNSKSDQDTSVSPTTTTLPPISFTIDHSWDVDTQLMLSLASNLDRMGHHMFKVILSYLTDYDLIKFINYSQAPMSNLVEEMLTARS